MRRSAVISARTLGGRRTLLVLAVAGLAVAGSAGGSTASPSTHAATTSYNWQLTPAGKQVTLGDLPMSGVLSPDGRFLVVSNDGQDVQSLQVVRVSDDAVLQTLTYQPPDSLFIGLAFDAAGTRLYASTGGQDLVRVYSVSETGSTMALTERAPIALVANGYVSGIAVRGTTLFAAENLGGGVARVDLVTGTRTGFAATGTSGPGCATQHPVKPGQPLDCPYPYAVLPSADGTALLVSNWGQSTVSVVDPATMKVTGDIHVGLHPNALALNPANGEVLVSNADGDSVSVLSADATHVRRTVSLRPLEGARLGAGPVSLTVSRDGHRLYVAESGTNDVAVVELGDDGGELVGLIPTAWFPTTVVLARDGAALLVLNGKGLGSGPNPGYQQGRYGPPSQYVGSMMKGTLSDVGVPTQRQLEDYTSQVAANDRFASVETEREGNSPVPRLAGQVTPIKHVIFVIKENRTYDQVFGDLGRGNGDPTLAMFGEKVTPNLHKLARQFVTLDNFYSDAEISAQGHNWVTAAQSNNYTEYNWPADYANDPGRVRGYDFEGSNRATYARDGFLWNAATRSNVSLRNFGEFVSYDRASRTWVANDPTLQSRTNPLSPGYTFDVADIKTPDAPTPATTTRYDAWNADFQQSVTAGTLPSMEILRLPNDHTKGTAPGALKPQDFVAQNDYAVGRVVDTVSHSPFWKDTAIFITEDDAQDGPDHVDGHRVEALVVSPFTQTGTVDSTRYDTVSMLKTMELIVGLQPLSQYDAAATPMLNSFTSHPDNAGYAAELPRIPTNEVNPANAPMATASAAMNFSQADAAPSDQLNRALWAATMDDRPYPAVDGRTPGDG